jgi:hypothetical protein
MERAHKTTEQCTVYRKGQSKGLKEGQGHKMTLPGEVGGGAIGVERGVGLGVEGGDGASSGGRKRGWDRREERGQDRSEGGAPDRRDHQERKGRGHESGVERPKGQCQEGRLCKAITCENLDNVLRANEQIVCVLAYTEAKVNAQFHMPYKYFVKRST